jgi:DNA-binding PadR family transcriptional regulator
VISPYRKSSAVRDVLYTLSRTVEERPGPVIADEIGRCPAAVYPILARLESAGWVDSRWACIEPGTSARQRLYRLSGHGVVAARKHAVRRRPAMRTRDRLDALRRMTANLRWGPA